MNFDAISSMAFYLMTFAFGILLFLSIKKPSEKRRFKDAQKFEKLEAERRGDIEEDRAVIGNISNAVKTEKRETEEAITRLKKMLEVYIAQEKKQITQIRKLIRFAGREEGTKQGGGLPAIEPIIHFCRDENATLTQVWNALNEPENLAKRLFKSVKEKYKKLKKDTHKTDEMKRIAVADDALSHEEIKRVRKEDKFDRILEDKLRAVASDEDKIVDELRDARKKCRAVINMNEDIIKIAEAKDQAEQKKIHDASKISELIDKKAALLNHILASLHVADVESSEATDVLYSFDKVARQERRAA